MQPVYLSTTLTIQDRKTWDSYVPVAFDEMSPAVVREFIFGFVFPGSSEIASMSIGHVGVMPEGRGVARVSLRVDGLDPAAGMEWLKHHGRVAKARADDPASVAIAILSSVEPAYEGPALLGASDTPFEPAAADQIAYAQEVPEEMRPFEALAYAIQAAVTAHNGRDPVLRDALYQAYDWLGAVYDGPGLEEAVFRSKELAEAAEGFAPVPDLDAFVAASEPGFDDSIRRAIRRAAQLGEDALGGRVGVGIDPVDMPRAAKMAAELWQEHGRALLTGNGLEAIIKKPDQVPEM